LRDDDAAIVGITGAGMHGLVFRSTQVDAPVGTPAAVAADRQCAAGVAEPDGYLAIAGALAATCHRALFGGTLCLGVRRPAVTSRDLGIGDGAVAVCSIGRLRQA